MRRRHCLHLFPVLGGSTDPVFLNTSQCSASKEELVTVVLIYDPS